MVDLLSHANAGNTDAIREALTDSGGTEEVGTFMVVLSAADIGLPAGGSVTLTITGDGYNYDGTAQAAGDGSISFELPRIVVGTTVTMTLEVKEADGSVVATGTKTQQVPEGGCDFGIALVDTAPAPAPTPPPAPEGFVLVGDLYVCIHEVTQAEYEAYCGYGGSSPSATYGVGPDYPAYYVSWYDAILYCNMRSSEEGLTPCYRIYGDQILLPVTSGATYGSGGKPCGPNSADPNWNGVTYDPSANVYRLPTEAEWLQAADDGHECSGADLADIDDVAWYTGNSGSKAHDVKTKAPNANGSYDMSGHVYEWCWDLYTSSIRVYRGGSWGFSAGNCAVSYRDHNSPNYRNSGLGFRLVRKAP